MAEKREAFWQRHRRAAALLGVLLAAALVAAWAGYDLGRRVDNRPVYAIVNDTYSRTVPIPAGEPGLTQSLPLEAGQRLYGVRLDFATFDHAFAGGIRLGLANQFERLLRRSGRIVELAVGVEPFELAHKTGLPHGQAQSPRRRLPSPRSGSRRA